MLAFDLVEWASVIYDACWKLLSPNIVPVQEGTRGNKSKDPGNGSGSFHIRVRTLSCSRHVYEIKLALKHATTSGWRTPGDMCTFPT